MHISCLIYKPRAATRAAPTVFSLSYALDRYSPVRVSILMRSPRSMKRGTLISAPVSTVAGLVAVVAVLPAEPGAGSVTSSYTKKGGSTLKTLPL